METAIDTRIRQEQAGFRKGRGCMDQIFALRNIIEQCLEWILPLYINFVDFRKAFDSVHRNTLWMILHSYGIPSKNISIIKTFYEHFECSVITGNDLSEWFPVQSGVRQGCIISSILFLVTIDWITTNTTADRSQGIQWTLFSQLEDLDFADDLALLSTNQYDMQVKTDRLNNFVRQVGLSINTSKTQVMCVIPLLMMNHLSLWRISPIQAVLSVTTVEHLMILKQDWERLRVPSPNSGLSGDQNNTALKRRWSYITAMWSPFCCTVLKAGELSKQTWGEWKCSIMDASDEYARFFWPNKISNNELYKKTGSWSIIKEITHRRLRWLGHVLRMEQDRITKIALRWTPPGKRKPGRPKPPGAELWHKSWNRWICHGERPNMLPGTECNWRVLIEALCPTGDEEE